MREIQESTKDLLTFGYVKLSYERKTEIDSIRSFLLRETNAYLHEQDSGERIYSLDQLHLGTKEKSLNDLRMHLITALNAKKNTNPSLLDNSILGHLKNILGHDLLIQKHVNLVLQRPDDPDNSETHRDYPGNSAFELVVWVPLVDCDEKMSLYLANLELSLSYARRLRQTKGKDWSQIKGEIEMKTNTVPVKYGEVLIFMTPLFHGSKINHSERTRVSLNFRVKALFSPAGNKDNYDFWNVYSLSPFTKACLEFL